MANHEDVYDVTIIGGGPAGLYSAFYSGMRDMKTKIVEYQAQLGGKILLYPEKIIWDIGGLPPTPGQQVLTNLNEQARTFEPTICLNEQIQELIRREDGIFILKGTSGETHYSKSIVLAVGHGIFKTAKLEIEGADRYEVTNLHYTVQQLDKFKDQHVIISGGGNSAVDWANALEPIAASVAVVHRRDEFGGHESNVKQMRASSVDVLTPYCVEELHGDEAGTAIERVTLKDLETEECVEHQVDAVIVNHGYKMDLDFLLESPLEFKTNEGILAVNEKMETSVPGVFAAGDLVNNDGKLRLIAGAYVDGAKAINQAKLFIQPDATEQAYVSSHNERFKEKNKELLKNEKLVHAGTH
ncbi:NAD(P)/FAD-dependent oxidoreductase [Alkalicoccobacillus plakortidis]|uniref:Ferredoxin--NADP reductase n=1 Tax=Alkalicoccobacillus plakortidis TaxID=444060 RepID=A0ABT0XLD7_9BACI|nr:NAD(P)/FAD-dependent oxidoreductase [Alkalicoccobacillus plakortidis]MCM2676525.1 NAD(P)/FAD-dependent oxidoreductase [Alkalicoccobacillus plakortidis]